MQFSLATKEYSVTLKSSIAKMINVVFKLKNQCTPDLANTMVVLFSKHVQRQVKNMSNCEVTFIESETSGVFAQFADIQFNVFGYGYEHFAGAQSCTGADMTIDIQLVKTVEFNTMLVKIEDDVYVRPVTCNATLQLGPC